MPSVVEGDEEEVLQAATAEDGVPAERAATQKSRMPDKSKLLLRALHPKERDAPRQQRVSLEVALFEPFVCELIAFAKSAAVGVHEPDGTDTHPDAPASGCVAPAAAVQEVVAGV